MEQQITSGPGGRILTNTAVWSPDSEWIVYDTRSDALGDVFDGRTIEIVRAATGEIKILYTSERGAHCGVATFSPTMERVVFILGPEEPDADWQYGPAHRQGVLVDVTAPGIAMNLDARDLVPPYTPGALRGGSHVHVFSPDGQWVSFTYNDHVLSLIPDADRRGVGVSVPLGPVHVPPIHPRNHDGAYFSVLVTRMTAHPAPGSDEIKKAYEDAWIGTEGYVRPDGSRQTRALAFLGDVVTGLGDTITELFVADLPDDMTIAPADGPLEGTSTQRPLPPRGTTQSRLTRTASRRFPGIQGPRHWPRNAPDGSRIACLMRDDSGIVQIWTVSPHGDEPEQITRDPWDIASAFTWSPDGRRIAYAADNSVFVVDVASGQTRRLTPRASDAADSPLPLACIYSPDGRKIAYLRRIADGISPNAPRYNQIFACSS